MKTLTLFLFFMAPVAIGAPWNTPIASAGEPARVDSSSCVSCHSRQDESNLHKPADLWAKDVHALAGLGCRDCHGGDPTRRNIDDDDEAADTAMDPARGFRQAPDRLHIPDFCARCHADPVYMKRFNPKARVDQLIEYRTSVHGQLNSKGDPVPATCIDCHGAHGIRRVSSPDAKTYATNVPKLCASCHADTTIMAPYKIPTNQYADYRRSVHATALLDNKDLAAPACNDCHGNHGATPPEARSVAHVCGQCHGREAALYKDSIKQAIFERLKAPQCITCHGNHLVKHPTPDLFDGRSAPTLSRGVVVATDPFRAEVGDLAPGDSVIALWREVLAPHIPAADPRYTHRVEIAAEGIGPLSMDATVRPGDASLPAPARLEDPSGLIGVLSVTPISGLPIEAGDALLFRLDVKSRGPLPLLRLFARDVPGDAVYPHAGSACLKCHKVGDSCDVATEKIFATIQSLDRKIRQAGTILTRAEIAGMEVSLPQYELKRNGISADVESRALIHTFDYKRVEKRAVEGIAAATSGFEAGQHAMKEMGVRRRGLAVSLVLIALVLCGLAIKIRRIDRGRET